MSSNDKTQNKLSIEIDFWILSDSPEVKQELTKQKIWNMRLEAWKDEQDKEKLNFWMVEKQDFVAKNLSQNQILNSAIIGEKNKMVVLKVRENDENSREAIRKLGGINVTETVLADKNVAKNYEDHEAWLLEKSKFANSSLMKKIDIKNATARKEIPPKEKKWPDDYYKIEEIKQLLSMAFSPEDKKKGDQYGHNLLLQGALILKLRESVKNIWDYLVEINLENMEERDLDGIKRTLVMIFNLFDAKCIKESKNKEIIYYCFSHLVRNCEECIKKEKLDKNEPEKFSPTSGAQKLFDEKYFNRKNTTKIFLGQNQDEELTGKLIIKDFPNLERIEISNTYENFISNKKISKLEIINCPKLKILNCRFHELTEISTNEFANLTELDCQVNKIKKLDLSKNTQLEKLVCNSNQLTKLDVSKNTRLISLFCFNNKLPELDLSNNPKLLKLECFSNPLTPANIKINKEINYFGGYPLFFLVRQGENEFFSAKIEEWRKITSYYQKKYYEMERIDITDLNTWVEQLNLKNIEDPKLLSKFIPLNLEKVVEGKKVYCLSLRIILDNLANQIKYRCLVFRNRLCEGENKEYEEQLKKWSSDWQKCGFMQPKYYLLPGEIESLVDRYTYPYIKGGEELRRRVCYLSYIKKN